MSAPLQLTSEQLRSLAKALDDLGRITEETGVDFSSYGSLTATIGDSNLRIYRNGGHYTVDDTSGS